MAFPPLGEKKIEFVVCPETPKNTVKKLVKNIIHLVLVLYFVFTVFPNLISVGLVANRFRLDEMGGQRHSESRLDKKTRAGKRK